MKIEDVMTRDVVAVRPTAPVKEVARCLLRNEVSGVPVIDEGRHVLGVVSETDILHKELGREERPGFLRRLISSSQPRSAKAEARTAGEAMSSPPIGTSQWVSIGHAAGLMLDHGVDRLVILDRTLDQDGQLIGIVTRGDLVRAFARSDLAIADEIRDLLFEEEMYYRRGDVRFTVTDGEVVVDGKVDDPSSAEVLEWGIARVPGVVSVHSELTTLRHTRRPEKGPNAGRI